MGDLFVRLRSLAVTARFILSVGSFVALLVSSPNASAEVEAYGSPPYYYFIANPGAMNLQVGPVARAGHLATRSGSVLIKVAATAIAGERYIQQADASFTLLPLVYAMMAPSASSWNSGVLKRKQSWFDSPLVQKIREVPGAKRVYVLGAGEFQSTLGVPLNVAVNEVLVVEMDRPFPSEVLASADWIWTKPEFIINPTGFAKGFKVHVRLEVDGEAHPDVWEVSLRDIVRRKTAPESRLNAWRDAVIASDQKSPSFGKRIWNDLPPAAFDQVRLNAMVETPSFQSFELGTLAASQDTRRFLGLGVRSKVNWLLGLGNVGQLPGIHQRRAKPCLKSYSDLADE